MVTIIRNYKSFDFILLFLVVALSIIGIILVGSATQINIVGSTSAYEKQKLLFGVGLVLLFMAAFLDYQIICRFYVLFYIINIILLLYVLFFTTASAGVNRWIGVGSFGIQPSEFSKLLMILFMAKLVEKNKDSINKIGKLFLIVLLIIIPSALIYKQPSLSASVIVFVISTSILFIGGLNYRYIIIALILGIVVIGSIYIDAMATKHLFADKILTEYQITRLKGVSMDQTNYSVQAIASGQFSGKGLYKGTVNQLSYLSESHNDFIFSVLCEEFGFVGAVAVLILVLLIVLKCLITAFRANTLLGKLIAGGVGAMIGFQTFFNVGVGVGMITNTGVPFPFLSSGGSSMLVNMIGIGLVINVRMSKTKSIFEE